MNTYTKLKNGEWGIRIEGQAQAGSTITVTKKSGEKQTVTIGKVVWSDSQISLCTIGTDKPEPKPAPTQKSKPSRQTVPLVEGEWSVERRSSGKNDSYTVGDCIFFSKVNGGTYGVIIEAGKYRDDDTDEWMCTARVRPATEDEIAPVRARREERAAAKQAAKELADLLRNSKVIGETDARLFSRPSDAVDIWAEIRSAGSERWSHSPLTGLIYYTESSWDDGPATWKTTATREQVEQLKATGLYQPSLVPVK